MEWLKARPVPGGRSALGLVLGTLVLTGAALPAVAADLDYPPSLKDEPYDRYGDRRDDDDYDRERYARRQVDCVPRDVVRHRLAADGWHDFKWPEPRGDYVVVDARRPNGRLFSLRIDRCSGEVVLARPLEPPPRFARWRGHDNWRDWDGDYPRRRIGWRERF